MKRRLRVIGREGGSPSDAPRWGTGLPRSFTAPAPDGRVRSLKDAVRQRVPNLWKTVREHRHMARDLGREVQRHGLEGVTKPLRAIARSVSRPAPRSPRVWLDLGDFGDLIDFDDAGTFQDHGLGLLRTILKQAGVSTDLASTRTVRTWEGVRRQLRGYDMLIMNVRSYTYSQAARAAAIFKELNPNGRVVTGGMHAAVSPDEMIATDVFDHVCTGPGEKIIVDLVTRPESFPRVFEGQGAASMAEWPNIDRTLWPKPASLRLQYKSQWPLEPGLGWGPRPVATVLTSRVCPWQCSFCNESSYIPNMGRRPVEQVIDELNALDDEYGINSVVIHDSMFFQHPSWLKQWLELYPKRAHRPWPYWAAGRADTVCEWPDLFERLVRETNWSTVSIGFESGSDPVLRMLNKQVTEAENAFTIELINRIGDEQERAGEEPVTLWSNVMLAIPGERPVDAIKTVRMVKTMKRGTPSIAFYAPYPGSALGHQLIAENKNLIQGDHERNPHDEKVAGVDYGFYRELLRGEHDAWIAEGLSAEDRARPIRLNWGGTLADLVQKA
ncbi:MAG: radical SAM protein [Myxococcota bacterium]|nr:radical SAM protein [Myxococcota bacterium]